MIENRRNIYQFIKDHPGSSLSEISKFLNLDIPLVDYHTRFLEENNYIESEKKDGYKRYYPKNGIGVIERKYLSILRNDIPLKIVIYLLKNPNSRHKEILRNFDISESNLTYYLNKLLKFGIIEVKKQKGQHNIYYVLNKKEITNFLTKYYINK